ncbi:MAG: hypothetical protein ACK2U9_11805 [Anaerolineae bacterium]
MTDLDKLRALLPHWIEHNAEHAAEFRRWAHLAGQAKVDIEAAAAQMEAANASLAVALETLGGPVEHQHHHHDHPHTHEE